MKPFRPPPPRVTRATIAACVAVQLLLTVGGGALTERVTLAAGLIPARLSGGLTLTGALPAPLTLVSSLFIHGGWLQLLLYLTFFAWVGRAFEWAAGSLRLALLYLLGGVAGGLFQVIADPRSVTPVIGASGAVAAVFGAYAVLFSQASASGRRLLGFNVSAELVNALWYAATWIGLQLLVGVAFNQGGVGIAIWTHIGGFILGLIFAQPLARRRG